MSLENAILENTAALKELIALLKSDKAPVQVAAEATAPVKAEAKPEAKPAAKAEDPSRARAISALNAAVAAKGREAVGAIFKRFGKTRVSDFETEQLGDLIAALEA